MPDNIKPCPFCGAIPYFFSKSFDDMEPFNIYGDIECGTKGCYLESGADWYELREESIAKWNTRTQ